jgi:hypothetical protein
MNTALIAALGVQSASLCMFSSRLGFSSIFVKYERDSICWWQCGDVAYVPGTLAVRCRMYGV